MGRYVKKYWQSEDWYGKSGQYSPYIPDQLENTDFQLDNEAVNLVAKATASITSLDSGAGHLTFTEPLARLLMRSEAMASSRIEGLEAPARKVLEVEALDELGVPHASGTAETAVLANVTALERTLLEVSPGATMTLEAICDVNRQLLADGPLKEYGGIVRTEQNWIGGSSLSPVGATYVPPEPAMVPDLLDDLVSFCNDSPLPAIATAAIVHAQFETIHPFVDGNGRTGRALISMLFRKTGLCTSCIPPVSLVLAAERKTYLQQLDAFRCDDSEPAKRRDISSLVSFFCEAVGASCSLALEFERRIESIEAAWTERVKPRKGSTAELLLHVLPSNPVVSVKSAQRLTRRSSEACRNALERLAAQGVLRQNARNKKSSIYTADEVLDELTALERALSTPGGNTAFAHPEKPVPQRRSTKPYSL